MKSKPITDSVGREIPPAVLPYWKRASEIKEMLSVLNVVINQIEEAKSSKDLMYAEIGMDAVAELSYVYDHIQCGIPYAVCTVCQGHPESQPQGCRLCLGRGLISKFRWNTVPEETRKMVMKGGKNGNS